MFGHDNQDDNQHNNDGHITAPAVQDDIDSTPLPSAGGAKVSGLGGFLTGAGDDRAAAPSPATDELLDIKQQALQALTPLVGHLDQSPEERFRTTMMMIQASDDHSLIKIAYDAAKDISDEKERAQALLDIVNEINYFTQQSQA